MKQAQRNTNVKPAAAKSEAPAQQAATSQAQTQQAAPTTAHEAAPVQQPAPEPVQEAAPEPSLKAPWEQPIDFNAFEPGLASSSQGQAMAAPWEVEQKQS